MSMSKYTSYTVQELIPIIQGAALDLMGEPITGGKKQDGTMMTMAEVSHQNSLTAMNNAGIRLLAQTLIDQLTGDGEEE